MSETSVINLMLAYLCAKASDYPYNVEILDRFGLADADIATVCGCTVGAVRAARAALAEHSRVSKSKRTSKRRGG